MQSVISSMLLYLFQNLSWIYTSPPHIEVERDEHKEELPKLVDSGTTGPIQIILNMFQNLAWIYTSPPHVSHVLQARETLESLLSEYWSRLVVTITATIVASLLALGVYYIFIKPAANIMRWLAWLTFIVGIPMTAAWLAWSVPVQVS